MKNEQVKNIRKIQAVLTKVSQGINVFFNITQYENRMGIVRSAKKWGTDSAGNKVVIGTNWYVTEKGQRILDIAI